MTARINVTLPWPPAECSPNSRAHWRKRHDIVTAGKYIAYHATLRTLDEMGILVINDLGFWLKKLQATYEFCPPDKRRRDLDNFQARCKPYLDGICDALGIDDSQIKRSIQDWGGVTDGGQVIITIEAMEERER